MTIWELTQQAITDSLLELWQRFIYFVPVLVGAIIVFIVGWTVAIAVGHFVQRVLELVRLNEPFERLTGLRATLERAGFDLNVPKFLGGLVKWFLYIVVLLATANILGLGAVADFLNDVLRFLPNIIVAAIIFVVGIIFGNFVGRVTRASIEAAKLPHGSVTGAVAKWAVVIFATLAALFQLGIAGPLIQTLFTAFVAMLAIAGGLAFGLGGKDLATKILKNLEAEVTDHG